MTPVTAARGKHFSGTCAVQASQIRLGSCGGFHYLLFRFLVLLFLFPVGSEKEVLGGYVEVKKAAWSHQPEKKNHLLEG